MSSNKMVIPSSVREAGNDPIFHIAELAKKRIADIGADPVINSTIGSLMDDQGNLVALKSVYSTFRGLKDSEIAGYASIAGLPEFLDNVVYACFKNHKPDGYIEAVATPGGTGAVRHAIANYSEFGDKVLVQDWHWAPYGTIAHENRRDIETFTLFDKDGNFNFESYENKMLELLEKQKRVLSILNTPAHNPTGYNISDDEWKKLVAFYTKTANEHPDWRIIVLCDIAYIDFAGKGESARQFMTILSGMPENVLPLYAYSASKTMTMYGLRNGALLCVAPTKEIAEEFKATCSFSNRGTWSNGTRSAQATLAKIISDDHLREEFEAEQSSWRDTLQKRAKAFMDAAKQVDLKTCTYRDGFFISIPCEHREEIRDYLADKKNFFIVALQKGLRFAPCAVNEEKCGKAPALIKEAINAFD
ncbi:pyridoxal phosphate-dependent aminotransferase [Pseudoramibacter sp.]|jgi:aromatic-amino-acid transaminase|uniref:pyridoxal phosphate-dependent aminotransferase n=1 Tax=Pseudoramibacter sp. TaxID=2034862 RepID=UPI0025D1F2E5|nr:aminotransferase class I/II-fold pyridoxal phosphate-dependent enzyme [Pseudoramibacter sp.]MCH4072890.1 aminotransferase class I/II-fold pyridoxal phosphate-dependent enzyme [Pseudoramibacter sp.]MCH4106661.1 aminotransferase class I/II-fold pyridoxal phosphate-dependent enzyme [Pseudoramibacter sp.]